MKTMYYIAYGSNLNLKQMQFRCPDAKLVATGFLKGYELLFRGNDGNCFCTIERCVNSKVPIGIFKITERCKMSLDRYEGYPRHYRLNHIKPSEILLSQGDLKDCKELFVYIMNKYNGELGRPSSHYYEVCLRGYHDCGLNGRYLQKALQDSINRMPPPKRRYQDFWRR